ncbi:MAG TPA: GNAT family N-acetyltransferase [Terrimicrobiaceae bacterium]
MNVSLRPPTSTDYTLIASWIPDAQTCFRWAGPRVSFPFSASELPQVLAIPGGESYCLTDGGSEPLGFGQHWPRADGTVHLLRVIVSPTLRGRGFGRELCNQLIARALEFGGADTVTLNVCRDNSAAIALYESLGFARAGSKSSGESLFMRLSASSFSGAHSALEKDNASG